MAEAPRNDGCTKYIVITIIVLILMVIIPSRVIDSILFTALLVLAFVTKV